MTVADGFHLQRGIIGERDKENNGFLLGPLYAQTFYIQ